MRLRKARRDVLSNFPRDEEDSGLSFVESTSTHRVFDVSSFSFLSGRRRNLCEGISGISSGSMAVFRPIMSRPEISLALSFDSSGNSIDGFSSSVFTFACCLASFLCRCFSFFLSLDFFSFFFFFFCFFSAPDAELLSLSFSLSSAVDILRFFSLFCSEEKKTTETHPVILSLRNGHI